MAMLNKSVAFDRIFPVGSTKGFEKLLLKQQLAVVAGRYNSFQFSHAIPPEISQSYWL